MIRNLIWKIKATTPLEKKLVITIAETEFQLRQARKLIAEFDSYLERTEKRAEWLGELLSECQELTAK